MPRTGSIASNVGPAVISTRLPAQQLGRERRPHGLGRSPSGFEHAAHADLAARLVAARRARGSRRRRARRLRDVALRRRVVPHLPVHRRRDEQRALAREAQRREQIVGEAVRELGDEIGGGGRDDDRVARRATARCAPCCWRRAASHRSVDTGLPDSACNVTGVTNRHGGLGHHDLHVDRRLARAGASARRPCRRRCRR